MFSVYLALLLSLALAFSVKSLALATTRRPLPLKTLCPPGNHRLDEALRQATWTVQSTAVHVCDIGSSREGVLSEWTTVETAQGTDVRHSAGNIGVSEVQQCCTGTRVPLDLTQVNC